MIFFINTSNFQPEHSSVVSIGFLMIEEDKFPLAEQGIQEAVLSENNNQFFVAQWRRISPSYVHVYDKFIEYYAQDPNFKFTVYMNKVENINDLITIMSNVIINYNNKTNTIFLPSSFYIEDRYSKLEQFLQASNLDFQTACIEPADAKCMQLSEILTSLTLFAADPTKYQAKKNEKGKPEIVNSFFEKVNSPEKFNIIT